MTGLKKLSKAFHLVLTAIFILTVTTACNSNLPTSTDVEGKTSTVNNISSTTVKADSSVSVTQSSIFTATPIVDSHSTTVSATQSNTPATTPTVNSHSTVGKLPLPFEVQRADKVFVAQVSKIGGLVWSSPDGKEFIENNPSKPTYNYSPEQLAPVELIVTTSFKGTLSKGEKLTILLPGAPGSKPYGAWSDFPKDGESILWFVGNEVDYRRGLSNNPLNSLNIQTLYHLQQDGIWLSSADHSSTVNTSELQQAISNPPQDPKIAAAAISPTPKVKPGQAVNLVKLHSLDKTEYIILKGNAVKNGFRITDQKQIQAVVSSLNTTLVGLEDLSPPSPQDANIVLIVFNIAGQEPVSFEYNLKLGYLTSDRTDYRVPAPPNLRVALGL